MRALPICLCLVALVCTAQAEVVRPAPDFRLQETSGSATSLSKLRGQPLVVIVADTPRTLAFRRQLAHLRNDYERLAAQKTLFIAAFTRESGVIPSNIPFLTAADGQAVASALGVNARFGIAIVGRDGNLDIITTRVLPAQRVLDIINNSFVSQQRLRRL